LFIYAIDFCPWGSSSAIRKYISLNGLTPVNLKLFIYWHDRQTDKIKVIPEISYSHFLPSPFKVTDLIIQEVCLFIFIIFGILYKVKRNVEVMSVHLPVT
jgi:hypothetical protein